MFDHLTSFVHSHNALGHYMELAGEIANSYLAAGAAPTDTLVKIARTEELVPHQIELVATKANQLIHNHKYASAKDKYLAADFPLADAKQAIKSLQLDVMKTASQEFAEPKLPEPAFDPFKAFGVAPETLDKTATLRGHMKVAEQKVELLQQHMDDRVTMTKFAAEDATRKFIKEARSYLITEESSTARMHLLGTLDHFVKTAGIPVGRQLLAKVAFVLGREGMLEPRHAKAAVDYFMSKDAGAEVPKDLISKKPQATVINGVHPLYVQLKTVGDLEADLLRFVQQGLIVQDKRKVLTEKIKAL